ncbi:MAG: type II secretion system F family protein [Candidatus Ozemobacteraceae bacterium]
MTQFSFQARDSEGKLIRETIDASDEAAAMQEISNRSLWVVELLANDSGKPPESQSSYFSGISDSTLNTFLIQISTMIRCGVSLSEAIKSLEQCEENSSFRKVLADVHLHVSGGWTFSDSLATHPEVFDKFFISMVKIGEAGGVLEEVLKKLASSSKRKIALKSQIIGAMAYPTILFSVAGFVLAILMGFAVPQFADLFQKANVPLPITTTILIETSVIFHQHGLLVLGILFLLGIGCIAFFCTIAGQNLAVDVALRLPVFRDVVKRYYVVLISEPLGLLLGAGVPLRELLTAIENTLQMETPKGVVRKMIEFIENGSSLKQALDGNPIFPLLAVKLVETGEKTGSLDQMFTEIAEFYDDQLQSAIKMALNLMEPLLIFVMAIIVGFIMLSIFIPLYQMSFLKPK